MRGSCSGSDAARLSTRGAEEEEAAVVKSGSTAEAVAGNVAMVDVRLATVVRKWSVWTPLPLLLLV